MELFVLDLRLEQLVGREGRGVLMTGLSYYLDYEGCDWLLVEC